MCRPRALMIPWLTECIRPKGLPRARTQVPTAAVSLLPRRAAGRSSRSSLRTAMSALASLQIRSGVRVRPSCRKIRIFRALAPLDHVMIGQDVEPGILVAADDHPGARLLELADAGFACRVFSATMWTTVGETALATSSNIRLTCCELLVLLRELVVDCDVILAHLGCLSQGLMVHVGEFLTLGWDANLGRGDRTSSTEREPGCQANRKCACH